MSGTETVSGKARTKSSAQQTKRQAPSLSGVLGEPFLDDLQVLLEVLGLGGVVREQGADRVDAPLEPVERVGVGEVEADERPLGAGDLRQLAQVDVVEHGLEILPVRSRRAGVR